MIIPRLPMGGGVESLTEREKEILLQIAEGLKSAEIADRLNISRHTINKHRANIIQKLKLSGAAQLAFVANKYQSLK